MLGYKGNNKYNSRAELLHQFSSVPVLALDSEWDKDQLLCISLATGLEGLCADLEDIGAIQPLLSKPLIIHNSCFDKPKIERELGIKLTLYGDSMLLAQSSGYMGALENLAFNFNFSHKPVTSLLYDSSGLKKITRLSKCPIQEVGTICIDHAIGSFIVYTALKDKAPLAYKQDMELFPLLEKVTEHGIRLDTALIQQRYNRLYSVLEQMRDRAENRGYNPGSSTQVGIFLSMKGINTGFTKTHRMRTDEAHLLPFIQDEDVALVLKYRELQKLCSTYLKPLLNCARQHSDYRVVSTGRLSSSPNIQNIPPDMRDIYLPDEGDWMVSFDLHQIEPRIAAHLSRDPNLLKDAFSGDVYQPVADRMGIDRYTAKQVWLAVSYGGTGAGSAMSHGKPISEEMAALVPLFKQQYPVYMEWAEEQIRRAEATGCAETLLGRKRNIQGQEKDAPNTIIQGTAAEVMKDMMFQLQHHKILASVHDEVLLSVKSGTVPPFSITEWHGIPLRVKTAIGQNYKDLKETS